MRLSGPAAILATALLTGFAPTGAVVAGRCDVKGIYKAVETPVGTIALTMLGDAAEVQQVLVPTKLEDGAYDVTVTRKGSNLYRVDGTWSYVATNYCYEYVYGQKAVLRHRGVGPVGGGSLIFDR